MNGPPTPDPLRHDILAGPDFFLHKLDLAAERALFVHLSRAQFAAASFLDDRVLAPQSQGAWFRFTHLARVLESAPAPTQALNFIFHMGHAGSTLLSRLIESAGGVLALREPLTLRTLAEANDEKGVAHAMASDTQLEWLMRMQIMLWRRGYHDTHAVSVKATSAAARLAPMLLAQAPEARAVYLYLQAEPYLAALLAGENSWLDLRGMGPERVRRLRKMSGAEFTPLHAMSLGELAAMTWACETLTRRQVIGAAAGRVLPLDFDTFLAAPEPQLRDVFTHLELEAPEQFFATIARSETFSRYAKATEAPYSPQFRAEILADSRARNGAEIGKGMAWLEALARSAPKVGEALG